MKSFTLWQLPEQTHTQMMSYVLQTPNGKVIVVDGGTAGDAPYLLQFLENLGGKVEAWFLTHPHSDHLGAIIKILNQPTDLQIECVYTSLPSKEWSAKYDSPNGNATSAAIRQALQDSSTKAVELSLGENFIFDEVNFKVLGIKNEDILTGTTNNSSIVLRVWDSSKSVLFLGDLGPEAGEKLLKGNYTKDLHADYVQMAHHGQDGANEDVYQMIHPTYCLWPTPIWLWNNDQGDGEGMGPWKTFETRSWIEKLGVKRNYVTGVDGLIKIE